MLCLDYQPYFFDIYFLNIDYQPYFFDIYFLNMDYQPCVFDIYFCYVLLNVDFYTGIKPGGGGGYSPQIFVGMCHGKVKKWQGLRNELPVEHENGGLRNELEPF